MKRPRGVRFVFVGGPRDGRAGSINPGDWLPERLAMWPADRPQEWSFEPEVYLRDGVDEQGRPRYVFLQAVNS